MCVCASDSSETVEVIIVKLGTDASRINYIDLQGHTYLNHENNKCFTILETIQVMFIKFAVKIVRLKVYMVIASAMTLTLIQNDKCVSNFTAF